MNYIDDFGGVESSHDNALAAFQELETLFHCLGLESSPEKDCPPSTGTVFLGLIYDTVTMTLEIPDDKLSCASALIYHWLSFPCTTKSDLVTHWETVLGLCLYQPWKNFHAANAF